MLMDFELEAVAAAVQNSEKTLKKKNLSWITEGKMNRKKGDWGV